MDEQENIGKVEFLFQNVGEADLNAWKIFKHLKVYCRICRLLLKE